MFSWRGVLDKTSCDEVCQGAVASLLVLRYPPPIKLPVTIYIYRYIHGP